MLSLLFKRKLILLEWILVFAMAPISASGQTPQFSEVSYGTTRQIAPTVLSGFDTSQIVAIVGTERVLAGDMAAIIEPIIVENKSRLPTRQHEDDARQMLIRQILPQYVELKALQQEFFRDMVGNVPPNEVKKARDQVVTRASKAFFDRFVPLELFKRHEVEDVASLEAKLQESGLSIALIRNHFLLQVLASELESKYVPETYDIAPEEILAYYQEHSEQWQIPARAKWRQLTVRFDQHATRAEAESLIRHMGNEVVLGGKPFEAVARDSSEGFTASEGGLYDWTTEGSLKSTALDQALFSLPLRRLSDVIEDEVGVHIIEVLERDPARTQDQVEIQTEIRKRLSKARFKQKSEEFRKKVLDRTVIWSRWPEDIPGSRPLEEAIGD